jgi:hypothetical protein
MGPGLRRGDTVRGARLEPNEIEALATAHAYVEAQRDYFDGWEIATD